MQIEQQQRARGGGMVCFMRSMANLRLLLRSLSRHTPRRINAAALLLTNFTNVVSNSKTFKS